MLSAIGEELTIIQPAQMQFVYCFGAGECHKVASGTCSLEKERPTKPEEMGDGEAHYDFCNKMLGWMRGDDEQGRKIIDIATRRTPIALGLHNCGHYSFS